MVSVWKILQVGGDSTTEATKAAMEQGTMVGELIATNDDVAAWVDEFEMQGMIEDGDPETLDEVEQRGAIRSICGWPRSLHLWRLCRIAWKARYIVRVEIAHNSDGRPIKIPLHQRCECKWVLQENADAWTSRSKNELSALIRNKDLATDSEARRH